MFQFNYCRVTVMAMCFLVAAFSGAYAQDSGEKFDRKAFGEKMEARIQVVYDQLGLSDEQKQMLKDNKEKNKVIRENLRQQLTTNMEYFGEELKKENYDLSKLKALQEVSKSIRNQMADDRFAGILKVRKILTQEQFSKFSQLMQEHKEGKKLW